MPHVGCSDGGVDFTVTLISFLFAELTFQFTLHIGKYCVFVWQIREILLRMCLFTAWTILHLVWRGEKDEEKKFSVIRVAE